MGMGRVVAVVVVEMRYPTDPVDNRAGSMAKERRGNTMRLVRPIKSRIGTGISTIHSTTGA
jgi:hypothetical protein